MDPPGVHIKVQTKMVMMQDKVLAWNGMQLDRYIELSGWQQNASECPRTNSKKNHKSLDVDKNENTFILHTEGKLGQSEIIKEVRTSYTGEQIQRAERARTLYHNVGAPMIEDLKSLIQGGQIWNCPVTIEDIDIAEAIFGSDMSRILAKEIKETPKQEVGESIKIMPEI